MKKNISRIALAIAITGSIAVASCSSQKKAETGDTTKMDSTSVTTPATTTPTDTAKKDTTKRDTTKRDTTHH